MGPVKVDRTVLEGRSIKLLRAAVKSKYTLDPYERRLAGFLNRVGSKSLDEFVLKAKRNKKWVEDRILDYVLWLNDRVKDEENPLSPASLRGYVKPLKLLFDMNDISVNWKKISRLMPSRRSIARDRAPTEEEMRILLSDGNLRFKSILLTMISSGIREGAWDYLDVGHLSPVEEGGKLVAGKLKVYAGTEDEYFTFITPEAYETLSQYLKYRGKSGETVTSESPLIREAFDAEENNVYKPSGEVERLTGVGVKRLFDRMLRKHSLRNGKSKRHEFSVHSFRKFFKTRAEQVMRPINVEILMGHSVGLSDHYYRPLEKELLEDYLKAVPFLSVTESSLRNGRMNHLEQEVAELRKKLQEYENTQAKREPADEMMSRLLEDSEVQMVLLKKIRQLNLK